MKVYDVGTAHSANSWILADDEKEALEYFLKYSPRSKRNNVVVTHAPAMEDELGIKELMAKGEKGKLIRKLVRVTSGNPALSALGIKVLSGEGQPWEICTLSMNLTASKHANKMGSKRANERVTLREPKQASKKAPKAQSSSG